MNDIGVENSFIKIENMVLNLDSGIRIVFTFCYNNFFNVYAGGDFLSQTTL